MKEQKKKQLIATLLLISCFISGYMLFATSDAGSRRIKKLDQVDSLIYKKLSDFNVKEQHIQQFQTRVNDKFIRKKYIVGLPYQVSKTQLHAELNNIFYDFAIETPARVTFPEEDVDIHLSYRETVVRTISLQTDAELSLNQNQISLLVTFDEVPDDELISQLASLGEPIPLVIKIENPMQASDLEERLNNKYNRIHFWLQNENGEDIIKANPSAAISKLRQLEDVLPGARILQLQSSEQIQKQLVSKTDLTFINASKAIILHEGMGKSSFFEAFHTLQSDRKYTMGLITGTETTLEWLHQKLPDLKKTGVTILSPPQADY